MWICFFCFTYAQYRNLPDDWDLVWQSAVCPECQKRVQADGGYAVVVGGAYSDGKPDPRGNEAKAEYMLRYGVPATMAIDGIEECAIYVDTSAKDYPAPPVVLDDGSGVLTHLVPIIEDFDGKGPIPWPTGGM